MKVLMLGNDESVHGGITTVINQFKNYNWDEKNINLKFISTYIDGNAINKLLFFLFAYLKIIMYCLLFKPDVVHMHMSYKGSFSRAYYIHELCNIFKIKDIIHLHGSEFKRWYDQDCNEKKKKKVKRLLKECNKIVVLGKEWEKRILSIEPLAKTLVVNNVVSVPDFESKFNKNEFNVLFLGVIIKRKGIYELLNSILELSEKLNLDNVKFIIAGSGKEEENMKTEARNLKIDKYIDFIGWVDSERKTELLKKSHLLVLPSYNEGLPMAILEAMSYGIPVVATNVGDVSEVVINEENGFLIRAGDVEALTNSILKIINLNQMEWEKFSSNSKKIIKEKFSDAEYFKKFEVIYKTI